MMLYNVLFSLHYCVRAVVTEYWKVVSIVLFYHI